MKPPAVNGRIQEIESVCTPSASRDIKQPDIAPTAVVNCSIIACQQQKQPFVNNHNNSRDHVMRTKDTS